MKTLSITCNKCGEEYRFDLSRKEDYNRALRGWFLSSIEDICPTCVGYASQLGKYYQTGVFDVKGLLVKQLSD